MIPPDGPIRVAIVGSRDYEHLDKVREFVGSLAKERGKQVVIVSGGARGVDSTATDAAISNGVSIAVWRPDWKKSGRRAGLKRNYQIVNDADVVVGFWDEESRGTAHSLGIAQTRDKLWKVFGFDGKEMDLEDLDLG